MTKVDFDLAIIGAGTVGMSCALLAGQSGFNVALIDAKPAGTHIINQAERVYAISVENWQNWVKLGIAEDVSPHATGIEKMLACTMNDKGQITGSAQTILFDVQDIAPDDVLSHPYLGYILPANILSTVLYKTVIKAPNIHYIAPAQLSHIENGSSHMTLNMEAKKAEPITAKLVIGCDGAHSTLRRLANIRWNHHAYKATSMTANLELECPQAHTARQVFTPYGPMALLPLGGTKANLIWSMPEAMAQALMKEETEAVEAELNARFYDFAGPMKIISQISYHNLALGFAEQVHSPRLALAGDAAHIIHPLAGQGMNLGLQDVSLLVSTLKQARYVGLDWSAPHILRDYAQKAMCKPAAMAGFTHMMDKAFRDALTRPLAGYMMGTAGRIPPLKRLFVGLASGMK